MDPSRTKHASQAVHLSDLMTLKFARERFGTDVPRYLRVTEPDGPSTDGGRKARQAILLCPQQDGTSTNLVCGFLDIVKQHAEIRSYAVVKEHFERRHEAPIDITRGEYHRMVDLVQTFLHAQAYETRITTPRPFRQRAANTAGPIGTPTALGSGTDPRTNARTNTITLAAAFLFGFLVCYLFTRLGWVG